MLSVESHRLRCDDRLFCQQQVEHLHSMVDILILNDWLMKTSCLLFCNMLLKREGHIAKL